jgi:hypothetical protein
MSYDLSGRTSITRAYAMLNEDDPLVSNFAGMILGVANSPFLDPEQRKYIIDLLEDQLQIELQCRLIQE